MFDRFATHSPALSASSAGSRAFSPAPRRGANVGPGASKLQHPARSSSQSLVSRQSSSAVSLNSNARTGAGALDRSQAGTGSIEYEHPLKVLQRIVGQAVQDGKPPDNGALTSLRPEILTKEVDWGDLSIQDFAQDHASERESTQVEVLAAQSTAQYEQQRERFEDLHRSIQACDAVLGNVESSLATFQRDLGVVSHEIETLQGRSTELNRRLDNRRNAETLLGPAVEDLSIAPNVVATIVDGVVGEPFVQALSELQKKLDAMAKRGKGEDSVKASADAKPLLENLSRKAQERSRQYFVAQIKAIRSPNVNIQVIQQQRMTPYKDLFMFLHRHHPKLAEEIGQAYLNTARWYFLNHFTRYREALDKLQLIRVEKTDVLGSEGSSLKGKPGAGQDIYSIGRRHDILRNAHSAAIPAYAAEEDKSGHFIETPFQAFNLALIDNVSVEYSFLTQFFTSESFHQHTRRCSSIFEPTFALGRQLANDLVATSTDCLGILLCVRLSQHATFVLQRRKVPVAESYLYGLNILLWPRLQLAMDGHAESLRLAAGNVSSRSAAAKLTGAFGSTSGSISGPSGSGGAKGAAGDDSKMSTAPHPLTQRFAQFLGGILTLSQDAPDDEPVSNSLQRLRTEYENFLTKASKSAGADPKKRERFLHNNYALVTAVIADNDGKLAREQKRHFDALMQN